MKKLIALLAVVLISQGMLMAQKVKTVQEKDVPERYVKDFQKKAPECKSVVWTLIDSTVYDATYINESGTKTAYRFSPKGTETRWYVDSRYYPQSIIDTVAAHYPKYKISDLYVLNMKNKTTYQAVIVKKKNATKLLNFETDGKFIDEIDAPGITASSAKAPKAATDTKVPAKTVSAAAAPKPDFKAKATPYGFVRNYFNFDSRNTYAVNGGEYNMIPYDNAWNISEEDAAALDIERADMNANPTAHLLALTTRFGLNLAGPELLGAKSSGKIEADFAAGKNDVNNAILRLRHAYVKLDWDNNQGRTQSLLMGQYWHPMSGDIMPEVLGMAAGAPFRAHSRTPQLTYTLYNNGFGLTASALYQLQYMYNGPSATVSGTTVSWSSTNALSYYNTAIMPELFFGLNYKGEKVYTQLGVDVQPIRPRTNGYVTRNVGGVDKLYKVDVNELNIWGSPTFYFQYTDNKFALKFRTTFAQNTSHLNQLNGYAVTDVDATTGEWSYAPMRASISYLNLAYGKKVRGNMFFGYMKNLGCGEDLYDFGTSSYLIFLKGGNNFTKLNSVFRVAPSISYNVKAFNIGLEYEMTMASFGDLKSNGAIDVTNDNFHSVINNRICCLVKYNF